MAQDPHRSAAPCQSSLCVTTAGEAIRTVIGDISFDTGAVLPIRNFKSKIEKIASLMPSLIRALSGEEIRKNRLWGAILPYHASYGNKPSLFHIIRPDIIITIDGQIKVCEFDFVPAGRGFVLSALENHSGTDAERFAEASLRTYNSVISSGKIKYCTGNQPELHREVTFFTEYLRSRYGIEIYPFALGSGQNYLDGVVDRLFYRSEVPGTIFSDSLLLSTSETFLDSKAIFALLHSEEAESLLGKYIAPDALQFLRRVTPETHLLNIFRIHKRDELEQICSNKQERRDWIIKGTEVDTDTSWGARSLILGRRASKADDFRYPALYGIKLGGKDVGRFPILQRFHESFDANEIWNRVIDGKIVKSPMSIFGYIENQHSHMDTKTKIHARVGPYIHVDRQHGEAWVGSHGMLTLRPDPVAHGASNALTIPFELR